MPGRSLNKACLLRPNSGIRFRKSPDATGSGPGSTDNLSLEIDGKTFTGPADENLNLIDGLVGSWESFLARI